MYKITFKTTFYRNSEYEEEEKIVTWHRSAEELGEAIEELRSQGCEIVKIEPFDVNNAFVDAILRILSEVECIELRLELDGKLVNVRLNCLGRELGKTKKYKEV